MFLCRDHFLGRKHLAKMRTDLSTFNIANQISRDLPFLECAHKEAEILSVTLYADAHWLDLGRLKANL
jgi:hypothetical protein